jgi:HlyD family secretion protein
MSLKSKSRRRIWTAVAVMLAAGLGLAWFLGRPRPEVEVALVTRGTFERHVEDDGRARVRDRFVIAAPVAATVERTRLHAGDRVARGDLVATLRPLPSALLDARSRAELDERRGAAQARLGSARLALERAQVASQHTDAELAHARALAKTGSIPGRELEHAELEAGLAARERDEARFAVTMATHELEVARAALATAMRSTSTAPERFELRAPVNGRILRVYQESEGPIALGAPLLEVGDPDVLEIVVDLLSTDAVQITPGAEAQILRWGGPEPLAARVRTIEPTAHVKVSALGVEEQRVDVVIDAVTDVAAWRRVGDGYRVDARILVERIEGVLRVPTSALFRERDDWCAFAVEEGRAVRRRVRLRGYGPVESAVESGLEEHAVVIEQPAATLRNGMRVAPRARR